MPAPPQHHSAVLVVGTGPAGLIAALALAHAGLAVTIAGPAVTPETAARDDRTTALFAGSIAMLGHLGLLEHLRPRSQPMLGLRLVDDTGRLVQAPETLFSAADLGRGELGCNFENSVLLDALAAEVRARGIAWLPVNLARLVPAADAIEATFADGTLWRGGLVVGADGRNSVCRREAGIASTSGRYPQSALVTRFQHERPHDGISTELHRRAGPLTTVPLPGNHSSLVWVESDAEAQRLLALSESAFADELEARLQGLLGPIGRIGRRAAFPLGWLTAEAIAASRVALVGEAAHVLPPIGAQGLNLGFRDAAWIAELAGRAHQAGADIGAPSVLAAYASARRLDIGLRSNAIDWLNRSLLADLAPLDAVRGGGIAMLGATPFLKRFVMREGLAPSGPQPALLRPRIAP